MNVRDFLSQFGRDCHDVYASMTDQKYPHYGNGAKALAECEQLGNQLLEAMPALRIWKDTYEANKQKVWLQALLEKGASLVKEYKEHSIYRVPVPPTDLDNWSQIVEANYTGALDVSFTAAAQQAYQAALRLPNVPQHHEGECYGGFICILCEDDEWRWSKQVLEEADMPNNIFWNPRLQTQFVEEMRSHATLAIPATWTYSAPKNRSLQPLDIDKGTPFQCVRSFVEYAWLRWSPHVGPRDSDFVIFKELVPWLPGLEEDVLECLGKVGYLRDMY